MTEPFDRGKTSISIWKRRSFAKSPRPAKTLCALLWPKFNLRLDDRLTRLRLWETPNNRFTLRR